ncbi:MAG TPA: beta-galactosidase [Chloroflexota bacterium]
MALLPAAVGLLFRLGLMLAMLLNPALASLRPATFPADIRIASISAGESGSAPKEYLTVNGKPFFPIGVSYHFTRYKDSWDQDLQAMRDLGLNAVRIDIAWRDVSPLPWGYQFGDLDDFLDRAARHGLYVVLVFSHTTQDFNTPLWFWPLNSDWRVADERGRVPLSDTPSIDHPAYRHQLEEYVEATARHLKDHPAVLAYQLLNEPRYDQTRLYDYSPYSVEMFRTWLKQKYGDVEHLNKTWDTSFTSTDDAQPPRGVPAEQSKPALARQWTDWRQFGYDNLADFVGELAHSAKKGDPGHPVIVSEMAWWWWGEQPFTGVSPLHIYRDADIVGYDLYPDGLTDSDYYLFTSDMLARYWGKPVWVMELNSKDGAPTGEVIRRFVSSALEGGASGVFYFQWRDTKLDGGNYGIVDSKGVRKQQYGGLATAIRWLKGQGQTMMAASQPKPDLYLVWPSAEVAHTVGIGSPAWALYSTARRIVDGGLRVGVVAEELVHAVEPQKLLSLRDGRLQVGVGGPAPVLSTGRGFLFGDQ